jgi:hypothetical protein
VTSMGHCTHRCASGGQARPETPGPARAIARCARRGKAARLRSGRLREPEDTLTTGDVAPVTP